MAEAVLFRDREPLMVYPTAVEYSMYIFLEHSWRSLPNGGEDLLEILRILKDARRL